MGWGFFNKITAPFVSIERSIEKTGENIVKVIKTHPLETAIIAGTILIGGAVTVATGGLAGPGVAELLSGEIGAAAAAEAAAVALPELAVPLLTEVGEEVGAEVGAEVAVETGVETGVASTVETVALEIEETIQSVFNSVKSSIMSMAETAQTQFATANEFITAAETTISQNSIVRGVSAIRSSKIVTTVLKMIMALEFIKTTIDILRNKEGKVDDKITDEDIHTKDNKDKIDAILDQMTKLKDALTDDKSKMTDLEKEITQNEIQNQEISKIREEVENMKELIGESFLRPLDFSEMKLLMNELEGNEIIQFLARNRKDYEKLSNREKKQVIELGKIRLNK